MRRWLTRSGRALAGAALPMLLALTGAGIALPSPALARPVTLEDLLQREGVGQAAFDPAGRWVVVERQGPYASGVRFDLEGFNDIARTTIWAAPVQGAEPLAPLFPSETDAGYKLGPISPDGLHVAVYRLKGDAWRLGVASFADRTVRWFDIVPELSLFGRALQWRTATELLVLTTPDGDLPRPLRFRNEAARKLPARWAASRTGAGAHTVFGSGRYLDARPQAPPRSLLSLDLAQGRTTVLAQGDFTDLELSPGGRRIALLEGAEDIRLTAGTPLQGDYGLATRRQRLRILDLATQALTAPAAGLDLLPLLAWSPQGDDLLIYGRRDGEPWTSGALLRLDVSDQRLVPAAPGLAVHLDLRPELVRAGWVADNLVVFGRRAAGGAAAWFRVTAHGPRPATGIGLPASAGVPSRLDRIPIALPDSSPAAPAAGRLLAARKGVTLRAVRLEGGAEQLVLAERSLARRLALLNAGSRDIDAPDIRRIVHAGPGGETLSSWLLLPHARPAQGSGPSPW
ncbi:hypothetical protein [Phenylobacterium sp. J367]|uniref:hypothetical protein n=1 Tax=Phenylobacterium sp. J367 TaxID=2898435 RepID=UPI0021509A82|nr:hypothetical protein [Phenylobacterium sp. J367]MCR5879458.1 hypothetical protein [Phenylobacterium sp. J367]